MTIKPKLELTFLFESAEWEEKLPKLHLLAKKALVEVLRETKITAVAQLSIVWADDVFVRDLNKTYRGKDKPTNILSFAEYKSMKAVKAALKKQPEFYLGDMVLAYETIAKEAIQQGKTLQAHVTHLLIHGMLHLLGYDHEEEKEAEMMERKEIALLARLGIENPYEKD